jgi:hypothetical protein
MKIVLQLLNTVDGTILMLLGKMSWSVWALFLATILLVPGAMLFQMVRRRWSAYWIRDRQRAMDSVTWRPGYRARETAADGQNSLGAIYEYSLYGTIVLLTALAVIFYMAGLRDQQISSLNRYASSLYFAVLSLAFRTLNSLYRRRKLQRTDPTEAGNFHELVRDDSHHSAGAGLQKSSFLGLSFAQFAVALLVFITACLTFTWALKVLR